MNDDQNYYSHTFKNERKLSAIAILVTILTIGLIAFNFYSEDLEDGFRDLLTEQGVWSQSQKKAVINLMAYVHTGTDKKYHTYEEEMYKLREEKKGLELLAQNSRAEADIHSFLNPLLGTSFSNDYESIKLVYSVYTSDFLSFIFPNSSLFGQSITLKEELFNYLRELENLGKRIRTDFESGTVSTAQKTEYTNKLYELTNQIIPIANQYTHTISRLSNSLKRFLLYNLVAIGLVLLVVGGTASIRYIKNLTKWKNELFKKYNELRLIFASSQDGIILIDEKGEIIKCNPSVMKLLNSRDQTLTGKNILDIFDAEQSDVQEFINKARSQEYLNGTSPIYLRDGTHFIAAFSASTVKDEKGKELLCIIIKDVTEKVNHLKKINESEKTYRDLLNSIQDGIILMEPDGTLIRVNEAAATMFGYSENEIMGMLPKELIATESQKIKPLSKLLTKAMEGKVVVLDRWGLKKDKTRFPLEITLSEGTFFDRNIIVGIFHDITNREKNIKQLHIAHEENRILLQEVHHRVKNNLAIINSFLQFERYQNEDNEKITSILSNSESRILTIAKIHELLYSADSFKNINLYEYISGIVSHLEEVAKYRGQDISFDMQISGIEMNANQALPVGLIVNELITNSIIDSFEGTLKRTIDIAIFKPDSEHIRLEIKDKEKGIHIDASQQKAAKNPGFPLIDTLVRQIDADLTIENHDGWVFSLQFKVDERSGIVSNLKS